MGRLEYQRGNYDAALQVFQGIDIKGLIPRMKKAITERTRPRKHRSRGDNVPVNVLSMHSVSLLLEAILKDTVDGNPDAEFLAEAMHAINKLSTVTQLRTFQAAMGKPPTDKIDWHNLVSAEDLKDIPKKEQKRQSSAIAPNLLGRAR